MEENEMEVRWEEKEEEEEESVDGDLESGRRAAEGL